MPQTPTLILTAVLTVGLFGRAMAQSPAPSPSPSTHPRFETVVDVEGDPTALPDTNVTVTKIGTPIQKTPASVSVVPAALVEDQGGAVLQDALKNVSGVTVGATFGIFDQFVVRGFDSVSSGLVLTDAAAEPEATQYPLYNVQRVEVLKGPAAFVYGGSPIASAVHIVRKQPQPGRFGNVDLSLGSFSTWDAAADLNAAPQGGNAAFRLNTYARDTNSWRDGRDGRILAINPAVRLTPGDKTRVDINVEYLRSEYQPDSGVPVSPFFPVPVVPRSRSYQSPLDDSRQSVLRLRLDGDYRISDQTTLHGKIYYTDLDWDTTATLITGLSPFGSNLLVNRSLAILDDRQKLLGNQLEAVSTFEALGARHRLLTGFENSRLTDRYRQDAGLLPVIDLLDPIETAAPPAQVIPGFSAAADARAWVSAPYAVDRITVSDRLEVFAGGRLDILRYEDTATATRRDDTRFSPSGGIVYTPVPNVSLYASATSAFAPPSSTVPGPRDPETSRQFEVGSKVSFLGGKGLASTAVYDLRRRNIAIPDAAGLLRQSGDQRSRGLEIDLRAETGPYSVLAGYAFTDATMERFAERVVTGFDPATFQPTFTTFDRSGNTAPFAPRHLFNTWAARRVAGFEVGLGLRVVGQQYIGEDNASVLDSYGILDAMVAYRLGRARFVVNLHNLTDEEYFTRGFGNQSVIPGAPFAAYARVEVGFGAQ